MPATRIFKGQAITLSTTEISYELAGDCDPSMTTINIVLVSGTVQATVAATDRAPILDPTYATYSTAGDKILMDMKPGLSTLRMKCVSTGVVNVYW